MNVDEEYRHLGEENEDEDENFEELIQSSTIVNLPTVSILESGNNFSLFKQNCSKQFNNIKIMLKEQKSAVSEILMMSLQDKSPANKLSYPRTLTRISALTEPIKCRSNIPEESKEPDEYDEDDESMQKDSAAFRAQSISDRDADDNDLSHDQVDNTQFYKVYNDWVQSLQKEEDEKEESSEKMMHNFRMKCPVVKCPIKDKSLPAKKILKNKDQELFIHSNIEWTVDKKYFRLKQPSSLEIKAREEYIQKIKELATEEYQREKVYN